MNSTEKKSFLLIIVIFIAACIETDIYLPAFPDMMTYFAVSEAEIQSLLTWNFFGICISGPLYGPLSDAFGRKKPLIIALALFLLGSFITLFSQNFEHMLWGRLLQGLGSGGCFTLGTAIIFDAFQAEKAVKAMSMLNTIFPFIMAGAPMLGAYLNLMYGFRSNFFAITAFVLISFVICLFSFDETLVKEKRQPFKLRQILTDFKRAGTSVPFWQLTLIISLLFAGYLTFLAATSVLYVIEFGISKQMIPFYQGALLGAWLFASLTCSSAIKKWGAFKMKVTGTILVVCGGLGFLLSAFIMPVNAQIFTTFMFIYTFGTNWVQALYFPESMEIHTDIKGITASLLTSARLFITVFVVAISSEFYNATIYPVAFIIAGIVAVTVPIIVFYERKQKNNPIAQSEELPMHF